MTSLLLPVTLTDDGLYTIGHVTAPAHAWLDALAAAWVVMGNTPADVAGRLRCRAHLDQLFRGAAVVRCWPTGSKAAGANLPAIRAGSRVVVRLSDTSTAVLLNHGGAYWQGFRMQFRDDSLAGRSLSSRRRWSGSRAGVRRLLRSSTPPDRSSAQPGAAPQTSIRITPRGTNPRTPHGRCLRHRPCPALAV